MVKKFLEIQEDDNLKNFWKYEKFLES